MTVLQRKPHRITITISDHVYQLLLGGSDVQGRSLSNLAAFLLENALGAGGAMQPPQGVPIVASAVNRSAALQGREQPLPVFRR